MNRSVPRALIMLALATGIVLAALRELTGASTGLATVGAGLVLGAAFPEAALVTGALVVAPQVVPAAVRGATDSFGLAVIAVVGGIVAAGLNALIAAAGAMARRAWERARAA